MLRIAILVLAGFLVALPVRGAEEPAWVAKVPDFRSEWPPPPPVGSEAPDFSLTDALTGRSVSLAKARKDRRATLVLFVDENCGTCKRRGTDLGASLEECRQLEDVAVLPVFTRNLVNHGPKPVLAFAEKAAFPKELPLLLDDEDDRAGVTLAYRISVAPTAVVLDADGKVAYFGLALDRQGSALLPQIVRAVAAGEPLDGPAVRAPFG